MATGRERPAAETTAEPVWDLATLFPARGQWSEEEYLALDTNRLVELSQKTVEVLPMPTEQHQDIVAFLYLTLLGYIRRFGGKVIQAPFRLRLWPGKFREPDLLFLSQASDSRRQNDFWTGADLVIEVVSADDPQRDLVVKRREYAQAGIPEYWIVNPLDQTVSVLRLEQSQYAVHGVFARQSRATSVVLEGFEVSVDEVFDAAQTTT